MIKRTIVATFFILSGFICFNLYCFAQTREQLDITTYYPSPTGVYQQLRLFPTDSIDPNQPCNQQGAMFYHQTNNALYVCDGTAWKKAYPAEIPSKTPAGWLPIVTSLNDPLVNPGTSCDLSGYIVCPDALGHMCEDTETPRHQHTRFNWCSASHGPVSWHCGDIAGSCVFDPPGRVNCCVP